MQEFIAGRAPPRLDDCVAEQMTTILGLQEAMFPGADGGVGAVGGRRGVRGLGRAARPGQLACSAVLAHALVGAVARAARAFEGAVAQQVGSFVGSCVMEVYSKKLDYQSGRPDLNQRPLDPQSRSVRRWASLSVAQWALDQA